MDIIAPPFESRLGCIISCRTRTDNGKMQHEPDALLFWGGRRVAHADTLPLWPGWSALSR
jgi:hypothetical protein